MPTKAQQRSDVPVDYWTQPGKPLAFGREQFRVSWVPGTSGRQDIDRQVEQVTWLDETAVLTGTVRLRDKPFERAPNLASGGQIVLECSLKGDGRYTELWRMWIDQPERDFMSNSRTFQLVNALGIAQKSSDDFRYRKSKAHPRGWRASQIAVDVARRYKIPVGVIATTAHLIKSLIRLNASPLEAIAAAYRRERTYQNKRYVISCDHGRLNILPLRRSAALLELGPTLIGAALQETKRKDFATALTVRASPKVRAKDTDKKNRKRHNTKKIMVKVESPSATKKYGYVHQPFVAKDADTVAEAQRAGLRRITVVGKPIRELSLSHPGLPTIRRGDALRALLPDSALNQVIFVTRVQHTVDPGDYRMDIGVSFTDPFVDAKVNRVKENKKQAARRRKRKKKGKKVDDSPKPAKAGTHSDATPGEALTQRGNP